MLLDCADVVRMCRGDLDRLPSLSSELDGLNILGRLERCSGKRGMPLELLEERSILTEREAELLLHQPDKVGRPGEADCQSD
jgi:hypothetical protein